MDEDPLATRHRARPEPPPPAPPEAAVDGGAVPAAAGLPEDAMRTVARPRPAAPPGGSPAAPMRTVARQGPALIDTAPPAEPAGTGEVEEAPAVVGPPALAAPRRPAGPPWALVAAALVVVAGAGFGAGWLSRSTGTPAATPTTVVRAAAAPFVVTAVHARLAAGRLACPSAVAHLSATLSVDHGGGSISYQWVLPGRGPTPPATVAITGAEHGAVVSLAFHLSGRVPLTGRAWLHLLSPLSAYSAPVTVRYACAPSRR
jgi:hypothetical protein